MPDFTMWHIHTSAEDRTLKEQVIEWDHLLVRETQRIKSKNLNTANSVAHYWDMAKILHQIAD